MQLIQENQAEFMRLINEPLEGDEENEMCVLLPWAALVFFLYCRHRLIFLYFLNQDAGPDGGCS
jgi:hypothetical protein